MKYHVENKTHLYWTWSRNTRGIQQLQRTRSNTCRFARPKNIPDTYPIQNTMKLHQVQDKQEPTETGKWHLHTSFHPCSCPECRSDPTEAIQKFLYREDRNICSRIISKKENNTTNDSNGISTLTCAQLRLELST